MSQLRRVNSTSRHQTSRVPLMVTPRSGLRVSDKTFSRLCVANRDLRLERTARGELIVMAPAGAETGGRNASLTGQLWAWNRDARLGCSFDSSAGYTLPNGAIRSPDASWIIADRWESVAPDARKRFAPICPDFVVELRSPSDDIVLLREKMREYVECGARLGWLLDPLANTVEIHRPNHPVETLAQPTMLSGEDVLPGFVLALRGVLFD